MQKTTPPVTTKHGARKRDKKGGTGSLTDIQDDSAVEQGLLYAVDSRAVR